MIRQIIKNFLDTDIGYSYSKSKVAIVSSIIFFAIMFTSIFAVVIAPYNPFDPKNVSLMDAFTPPSWTCLLYTSPSPRDVEESRMPSSA